jgi:hypothetical protein
MANDDIVILNNLGNLKRRESKTGKVRYTIEVKSEPLIHDFDPKTLGGVVAAAIAEELRRQVKAITQRASDGTLKARAVAAKAFAAGKPWATRAFGGGKMGPMAPNQSDRSFNDSGRLAAGIVAQAKDDKWTVNIPSNRFDPTQFKDGELGVARVWRQLVALVPAFQNTALLFETEGVKKSIDQSMQMLITKARETRDQLSEQRAKALMGVARQALGLLRLVG